MPRGGLRPGAGRPRKPPSGSPPPAGLSAQLHFETAAEFGIWSLNAPDYEVSMDQKIRAMQALLMLDRNAG